MDPILQQGTQAATGGANAQGAAGANGQDAQMQQEMAKAFQQVLMQVISASQGEAMQ